jgi:hypothetical protein
LLREINLRLSRLTGLTPKTAPFTPTARIQAKNTQWLAQRGIQDRMAARAFRNKPLTDVQKVPNRLWACPRCTFGILKLHCGMAWCCLDAT